MKKLFVTAAMVAGLFAAPALSADLKMVTKAPPPPAPAPSWDIAFGGAVMTDYNFRGISQSNKGMSGSAYIEPQFTTPIGTLYVGLGALAINWPSGPTYGFTDPSAEVDIYGGWRNTWGKFSLDLGAIYYYYPKEIFNGFTSDSDFWEIYAKAGYAVTSDLSIGANIFYTPDLLNYSESFAATGGQDASAVYASVTAKWVLPWKSGDLGAFVSGELGHWWISDTGFIAAGFADPSYTYYNIGLAFTYKAITLDLRYHGTDQSVADCANFLLVAIGNASNNWCDDTFIASVKFDTALSALK
jgi:uncharacterized protein (TIGR02001 family)